MADVDSAIHDPFARGLGAYRPGGGGLGDGGLCIQSFLGSSTAITRGARWYDAALDTLKDTKSSKRTWPAPASSATIDLLGFGHSSFEFDSNFVVRASSFRAACDHQPLRAPFVSSLNAHILSARSF